MPSLFLAVWGRQHLKIWGASSSAWAPTSPWYHLLTASFRLLTTPFPIPNMGRCHGVPFHQDIEGHGPWGPISPRYRGLRPLPPRTNPIGSFGADASCPPDGGMVGASLGNLAGSFCWVSRLAPFFWVSSPATVPPDASSAAVHAHGDPFKNTAAVLPILAALRAAACIPVAHSNLTPCTARRRVTMVIHIKPAGIDGDNTRLPKEEMRSMPSPSSPTTQCSGNDIIVEKG